jgi:hypothetical protein
MSSAENPSYKEIIAEVQANFSVIYSTIESLRADLDIDGIRTSYVFISENIKKTISYIRNQLDSVIKQAREFEQTCITSPLQISTYKGNPEVIFEYRDGLRGFADQTRRIVDSLPVNLGKTLAAYIIAYETLEKFGFKPVFVLVESNEFLSQNLREFIFGEFQTLGPRIEAKPSNAYTITYSGIDMRDPLSLLIVGHETFHIIDSLDSVFRGFCHSTGFNGDQRSMEAFVDIMSSLYFGPVYTSAMQKHFRKRYPLSGKSHPEMNIRLMILHYLESVLGYEKTDSERGHALREFIELLEKRMDADALAKAKHDQKRLDMMLNKGVIGYIKHYFKEKKITPYDEFVNVEKEELGASFEKFDRDRIRYMLRHNVAVAVRPITLLNALDEGKQIEIIDPRLVVASVKKWYVKRYYQKSIERRRRNNNL